MNNSRVHKRLGDIHVPASQSGESLLNFRAFNQKPQKGNSLVLGPN